MDTTSGMAPNAKCLHLPIEAYLLKVIHNDSKGKVLEGK